jgi:carboxyl-terminal processing protease
VKRTLFFTCVAFVGGMATTLIGGGPARATSGDESPYAAIGQLGRVLVQVENSYVEPVDRARLLNGAIVGMVAELDPHSSYLPPQEWKLFQSETEGKFGGVGIEVDARGDLLTVIAPIEGSPAAKAGIKSGDKILAIDNESAVGEKLDRVVRKMRGTPGTHVKLAIRREGVKEALVFDLVREVVHVPSVASKLLEGRVAYVRIKQFQEHTHDELVAAAGKLRAEAKGSLAGVMLDLRSDPGGLVDEAAETADEFLNGGTIYTMRHRGQVIDEAHARPGGAFADLPVVVLVNEYSASASELVAGALQDHKRATIVGANTFGKGSVQSILELPGGAGLRLTTARYYTPSGRAIQAVGVHPDIAIESSRVPDNAGFVLRERDLEGHLPAEGLPRDTKPQLKLDAGPEGGTLDIDGASARNIPVDPTTSTDFALRIGYQLLRGQLVRAGTVVR